MQVDRVDASSRLGIVLKVDKVVIEYAEKVVSKGADHYLKLMEEVAKIGTAQADGTVVASNAPRETSAGSPVKSELEEKIFLMSRLTASFMALANGAKALGLVKLGDGEDARQALDPAKLAGLSLTIINKVDGRMRAEERPVGEVLDLGGPPGTGLPLAAQAQVASK